MKRSMPMFALLVLFFVPAVSPAAGIVFDVGLGAAVPTVDGELLEALDPDAGPAMTAKIGTALANNLNIYLDVSFMNSDASGLDFSENMIGLNLRYFLSAKDRWQGYIEGGPGMYSIIVTGSDGELTSDPVIGGFIGGGINYYPKSLAGLTNGRIGVELTYHFAKFAGGEFDLDSGSGDADFDGNSNMVMLMFTLGYDIGVPTKIETPASSSDKPAR